jgi:hypothetical protein
MTQIHVGDVYARREPLGNDFDTIKVVGLVDHKGFRPDEWTVQPAHVFGPTIQTTAEGITEFCNLVTAAEPQESWQ